MGTSTYEFSKEANVQPLMVSSLQMTVFLPSTVVKSTQVTCVSAWHMGRAQEMAKATKMISVR